MNFMEKSKELLLVHTAMQQVSLSQSVDIMLTPQFYTLKKEKLPVRYAYQAKRVATSLFDGLLDKDEHHDFFVYKEEDQWVFIAYSIDKISAFLNSKGFKEGDVSKIFFAQQSPEAFGSPYLLSDQEALAVLDGTVVVIPKMALGDEKCTSKGFDNRFTPKRGVLYEHTSSSLLTLRQTIGFATIFTLFAFVFFAEGMRYGEVSGGVQEQLESLQEAYPSLQSKYTREGVISKYRDVDTKERAKRDAVKDLSSMIFKGVTLTSLEINTKSVKAAFMCRDKQVAKRVANLGKKSRFNVTLSKDGRLLTMERTL